MLLTASQANLLYQSNYCGRFYCTSYTLETEHYLSKIFFDVAYKHVELS